MSWLLLAIATCLTCELFVRLPFFPTVQRALDTVGIASHVMASPAISDHWKERVLPRYSVRMLRSSLATFALIVAALSPFLLFGFAGTLFSLPFAETAAGWTGIAATTGVAIVYFFARNRIAAKPDSTEEQDYSASDQLLHSLVLASPSRGETLFAVETRLAPKPPAGAEAGRHVFVTGLARAGTTVLMRAIHGSGQFASLTYRDMPFVMAPTLWAKLSGRSRKSRDKTERAHGDGIAVDFDSPEALEEPFWRTFCGRDYIRRNALVPHEVTDGVVAKYRSFVGHVLARYTATRYVAKNNNAILRLAAIHAAFPQAVILAPFRVPLDQAASLMRQHARFEHDRDPFTVKYMRWLAHHEFGGDQRPYAIDGKKPEGERTSVDYWLSLWIVVYRRLLEICEQGSLPVTPIAYEDYCGADRNTWRAICRLISIPVAETDFRAADRGTDANADAALLATANGIYDRLRTISHLRLAIAGQSSAVPVGTC